MESFALSNQRGGGFENSIGHRFRTIELFTKGMPVQLFVVCTKNSDIENEGKIEVLDNDLIEFMNEENILEAKYFEH